MRGKSAKLNRSDNGAALPNSYTIEAYGELHGPAGEVIGKPKWRAIEKHTDRNQAQRRTREHQKAFPDGQYRLIWHRSERLDP